MTLDRLLGLHGRCRSTDDQSNDCKAHASLHPFGHKGMFHRGALAGKWKMAPRVKRRVENELRLPAGPAWNVSSTKSGLTTAEARRRRLGRLPHEPPGNHSLMVASLSRTVWRSCARRITQSRLLFRKAAGLTAPRGVMTCTVWSIRGRNPGATTIASMTRDDWCSEHRIRARPGNG